MGARERRRRQQLRIHPGGIGTAPDDLHDDAAATQLRPRHQPPLVDRDDMAVITQLDDLSGLIAAKAVEV